MQDNSDEGQESSEKASNMTMPSSHSSAALEQSQSNARAGVPKRLRILAMLLMALSSPAAGMEDRPNEQLSAEDAHTWAQLGSQMKGPSAGDLPAHSWAHEAGLKELPPFKSMYDRVRADNAPTSDTWDSGDRMPTFDAWTSAGDRWKSDALSMVERVKDALPSIKDFWSNFQTIEEDDGAFFSDQEPDEDAVTVASCRLAFFSRLHRSKREKKREVPSLHQKSNVCGSRTITNVQVYKQDA